MLRIALLFFCMLGFLASEVHAEAATGPLHRRKPMAGNYRPVYKLYRNHSSRKNGTFTLFKRRSKIHHHSSRSRARLGI
ncbi:hypothetical protein [Hymenobacter terrenus]|uniref:hypothetical protein n=1 Tax=Hymenobacter terrenus TaxID=1629124 RepID=UPI0006195E76|nr:hypothetical protein [Hymenobacter terrenus]